MTLDLPGSPHLTYCTNIHRGESWPEVRATIARHVVAVKARVVPNARFGVGLRLSARAAEELARRDELARFKDFLRSVGLYIFTINGFPYGPFHGQPVKADVYRPDWREDARLHYTNLLAELLADLLPSDGSDQIGTISTVPLAYAPGVGTEGIARCVERLLSHVARLIAIRERTGKTIALALEPEPGCVLESAVDAVRFFDQMVFSRSAVRQLAHLTGLSLTDSESALRRHLGICFDACHLALQFIEPAEAVRQLSAAGIPIHKVQVSTGLRVVRDGSNHDLLRPLGQFADAVYLHQAVVRSQDGTIARYMDLPELLQTLPTAQADWQECRIHFHVPIVLERLGPFFNTQPFLHSLLDVLSAQPVAQHLEVETYTWEMLPEAYRTEQVEESIARELMWVRDRLTHVPSAGASIGNAASSYV